MPDRDAVHRRLREDLIGPHDENEILSARPSDLYLTGILWPAAAEEESAAEADDALSSGGGEDDGGGEEDAVRAGATSRPSTAGVSFAVASETGTPHIEIEVRFATYIPIESAKEEGVKKPKSVKWQRRLWHVSVSPVACELTGRVISLSASDAEYTVKPLEGEEPAPKDVVLHVRSVRTGKIVLTTVTLWNRTKPAEASRQAIEQATIFQTEVAVRPAADTRLVARPARRSISENDELAADLLYRDAHEYAAGHTCGADWVAPVDGKGGEVRTAWMPVANVSAVSSLGDVEFRSLSAGGADPLDAAGLARASVSDMCTALSRLPAVYLDWITRQETTIGALTPHHQDQARRHMAIARAVAASMQECVDLFRRDAAAAEAFQLANKAMTLQFGWTKESGAALRWRPFQLGFVLLSIPSLIDRKHRDRRTMDLLWFPTGGGKTEAYLTLISFLAFHRRLRFGARPDDGGGVAAIMRYTLRLLTTQQFERAAAMIIACDTIRRTDIKKLGSTRFSIGLWAGGDVTPNSFAKAEESLVQGNREVASPKQLDKCPACRSKLVWTAAPARQSVEVRCTDQGCALGRIGDALPVWTVDSDVYRECPTLLIGTIDKFAQIARGTGWRSLFAMDGGAKPDLVIQDELHLISGPLGTIAGIYEVAVDRLLEVDAAPAKVIGSTATIRRADEQIKAVFDRSARLFPPPGLSSTNSGFAVPDTSRPGRLFVGVTTAGRSAKFTLQATAASLLQSGHAAFADDVLADPYRTLVTYFNSLRELGGALVLMQDDVADSIDVYRSIRGETRRSVVAVEELTSRRSQVEVRDMLEQLAHPAGHQGMLDVVLASNMLSVGVDVPRLGLMLVNGQPKGIAEYIQATSRIGRGQGPGLVIAVLNNAKARDRSHFETFRTWHETLYRDVEATSVTPFAARARDRAMHAALVTLVHALVPGMASPASLLTAPDAAVRAVRDWIATRARAIDQTETDVLQELDELLDEWRRRAPAHWWHDFKADALLQSAERVAMRRANGRTVGGAWPTMNNMRSVEASTHFRLAEGLATPRAPNAPGNDDGK